MKPSASLRCRSVESNLDIRGRSDLLRRLGRFRVNHVWEDVSEDVWEDDPGRPVTTRDD